MYDGSVGVLVFCDKTLERVLEDCLHYCSLFGIPRIFRSFVVNKYSFANKYNLDKFLLYK